MTQELKALLLLTAVGCPYMQQVIMDELKRGDINLNIRFEIACRGEGMAG